MGNALIQNCLPQAPPQSEKNNTNTQQEKTDQSTINNTNNNNTVKTKWDDESWDDNFDSDENENDGHKASDVGLITDSKIVKNGVTNSNEGKTTKINNINNNVEEPKNNGLTEDDFFKDLQVNYKPAKKIEPVVASNRLKFESDETDNGSIGSIKQSGWDDDEIDI